MSDAPSLSGKRIAIFVEHEFEDRELIEPLETLRAAGATVVVVGPFKDREYRGRHGHAVTSELNAGAARAKDFDAVVIPGGYSPDKLRMRHALVEMTHDALVAGKPVAAISHGPQLLISANVLKGRTLTCWPSIAVDIKNAGGMYVDRVVAIDGSLITSRKADDIPAFCDAIIAALTA